jgi:hypothetical protein
MLFDVLLMALAVQKPALFLSSGLPPGLLGFPLHSGSPLSRGFGGDYGSAADPCEPRPTALFNEPVKQASANPMFGQEHGHA